MSEQIICLIIGIVTTALILGPFFVGRGGALAASSSLSSRSDLENLKELLLKRFLQDEKDFSEEVLTKQAWEKRQRFLKNRYIDASRRLDFVLNQHKK